MSDDPMMIIVAYKEEVFSGVILGEKYEFSALSRITAKVRQGELPTAVNILVSELGCKIHLVKEVKSGEGQQNASGQDRAERRKR